MSGGIIPTLSNLYSQFNPIAAVSSCSLWLDAADPSTFTLSGSNVTQWNDKTVNGRHATVFSASPTRGFNSVKFNGIDQGLQTSLSASDAVASGFVMVTLNNFSAVNTLLGSANGNGGRQFRVFNTIQTVKQGVSNILITGTNLSNGQSLLSYVSNLDNSTITHFSRGATYATGTQIAYDAGLTTSIGCRFGPTEFLNGDIHEILVFSRNLTTFEREQIEGYLAWKWYYQINLSGTHAFLDIPPVVRDFLPTDILTPTFWLDAADPTSLTLSGSTVTAWRDKSVNGFSGTSVGSPQWTTVDGYPAITFNGSTQYFNFGDVADLGANQLNIFVVSKFNPSATGSLVAKSANTSTNFRYALLRDVNALRPLLQHTTTFTGTVADSNNSRRILSWRWDRLANRLSQNSTNILGASFINTSTFNSAFVLLVGAYNNSSGGVPPSAGYFLNGSINEILFYFTPLTVAQIERIEGYLAQKWGLQKSLPTTHPFYSVFPKTAAFNPRQITGCTLWLDASDPISVTLAGSTVTAWRDKSGLGNHTTVAGSPVIGNNINSRRSITTGVNNFFTGPISITGTTLTCFAVATTTLAMPNSLGSGGDQRLVSLANGVNVDYGRTDGAIALFNQQSTDTIAVWRVSGPLARNVIVTNTPFQANSQFTGTAANLRFNGSPGTLASSASSGTFAITKYGIGNQANPITEYWRGFIGEVIIYNTALTTAERQQVEGYLAWKWGLQNSLPTTHPYRRIYPL